MKKLRAITPNHLKKCLEMHEKWLMGFVTYEPLRLIGYNLADISFRKMDMRGVIINNCNLSYCDLSYTDFTNADLKYNNFTMTYFYETNFTNADLYGSTYNIGHMTNCNIKNIKL